MLYTTNKLRLSRYLYTASGNPSFAWLSLSVLHYFIFSLASEKAKMHAPYKTAKKTYHKKATFNLKEAYYENI